MRTAMLGATLALTLTTTSLAAQRTNKPKEPEFDGRPLSSWVKDLKADAPQIRNAAAYVISGMGADAKSAVPALIESLDDPEAAVRFPVCVALREIGPDAAAAVPALEKLMREDRNDDVAAMARKAIKAITGKDPTEPEGN
jgi:HEAT repeat protein